MRRLDGFSAFTVYNDVPRCYQHTLKIALLKWDDPEDYCYEQLINRIKQGLEVFPIMKWKLGEVPFGLNHPVWIQDTEFNIHHHVRRIALPRPGNKAMFCELVSELYAHQLDKSRPLWLSWIVEGLEDNQVAMVTMFHHAYADGAGAGLLMQGLFAPEKYTPLHSRDYGVNPDKNPSQMRIFLKGIVDLPCMFAKTIPALIKTLIKHRRTVRKYIASGKVLPPDANDAPDSPLNTTYTYGRTFAYETFKLDDFKSLSKFFGVTINDLLVATVCGAVRQFYKKHDYPITRPLVAGIPINMRTREQEKEVLGNYVANSFMWLPIQIDDPEARLTIISESGNAMKSYIKAISSPWLFQVLELTPPLAIDLLNWLLRRAKGQLKLFGNLAISNVRGPSQPMTIGKAKVDSWLSIGQLFAGVGVNITAWAYVDKFSICLMAEKKVIPNGMEFMGYIEQAFAEYQDLCLRKMQMEKDKKVILL